MAAKATKKKKQQQAKPKEAKQQQNVPVWRYMNNKNYGKHYLYHETRESRARKEAEKKEKENQEQQKNVQQPKVPSSKEEEVLQSEKKKEEVNEVDKKQKSQNQRVDIPQQTSTSSPKKVEIVEAKQTNEAKKEEPKVAGETLKTDQKASKMKPPPEMDKMQQPGAAVFIPDSIAVVIGSNAEEGGEEGSRVEFVEIEEPKSSKEEKTTTFAVVSENSAAVAGELSGLLQQVVKKEVAKEEEKEKVKNHQKQVGQWLLEKMRVMGKGREHQEKQQQQPQQTTTSTSSLLDKVKNLLKEYQLEEVAEALQKGKERLKPHLENTAQHLATSAELVKRKINTTAEQVLAEGRALAADWADGEQRALADLVRAQQGAARSARALLAALGRAKVAAEGGAIKVGREVKALTDGASVVVHATVDGVGGRLQALRRQVAAEKAKVEAEVASMTFSGSGNSHHHPLFKVASELIGSVRDLAAASKSIAGDVFGGGGGGGRKE